MYHFQDMFIIDVVYIFSSNKYPSMDSSSSNNITKYDNSISILAMVVLNGK